MTAALEPCWVTLAMTARITELAGTCEKAPKPEAISGGEVIVEAGAWTTLIWGLRHRRRNDHPPGCTAEPGRASCCDAGFSAVPVPVASPGLTSSSTGEDCPDPDPLAIPGVRSTPGPELAPVLFADPPCKPSPGDCAVPVPVPVPGVSSMPGPWDAPVLFAEPPARPSPGD